MLVNECYQSRDKRKQNTFYGKGYPQRDSAEHEGYAGAHTDKRITENNNTNANSRENGLLEKILSRENLNQAYKQVKRNKGAHGIDGMEVEDLLQYLKDNGDELVKLILDGKYRPNPVRRVEIPKDNGKNANARNSNSSRQSDPTSHRASANTHLRTQLSETSYGFRPKRSAHDALRKCKEYQTKDIHMS